MLEVAGKRVKTCLWNRLGSVSIRGQSFNKEIPVDFVLYRIYIA